MKNLEKIIGIGMLLFAIGFNLWVYRLEPAAKVDPNDNTFQFALVDRTNQIWDFANKTCTTITKPFCMLSYLSDHWVPNWAEGYNLPYYYSHAPQIVIVASYRLISALGVPITLFAYYHWITYMLLSIFPLSVFLALLIVGLSPITAGFGSIIASQISTDGLYGLDPSSFIWRGWGLTSQLYAMIFLPFAIAFTYRLFTDSHDTEMKKSTKFSKNESELRFRENFSRYRNFLLPILFLAATTAGHLGIGIIAFLSVGMVAIAEPIFSVLHQNPLTDVWSTLWQNIKKLLVVFGGVFLLLGYWIIPILTGGNYHNTSVWDPIWKFDSYGYRVVLTNFFNGDLFDFHRFPTLTILVIIGLFRAASGKIFADRFPSFKTQRPFEQDVRRGSKQSDSNASSGARKFLYEPERSYFPFALLFIFWLLLYFGTTTWGHILYLIPGMSDFHISRFIVGVHIAGLFLIPVGFEWGIRQIWRGVTKFSLVASGLRFQENFGYAVSQIIVSVIIVFFISPQTLSYASYNDTLIKRANTNYDMASPDINLLLSVLRTYEVANPGRVFAGRGGGWGKSFRIAETPMYMHLSTFGIPTVLWLPETWSPNSDTEQYFRENVEADYSLYNIRYIVTPVDLPKDNIQPFWKPLESGKIWKLYEVPTTGYITTGVRPAIVSVDKLDYLNVTRLWIQSDYPKEGLYPELTFDKNYPVNSGLPNFRMLDDVTYKIPDGSIHDLMAGNPVYQSPTNNHQSPTILSQSDNADMVFSAKVTVPTGCTECIMVLKQSAHPSWRATVDGSPVDTLTVFPFFSAVKVSQPGNHTITFSYQPSTFKVLFLIISIVTLVYFIWVARPNRRKSS